MRTFVRMLAQVMAIALLFATGGVEAQGTASAATKARARELYTQGQQLFRQGDFNTAQRAFEDAYRAVPNPVVLLSIAECQVRNEDYAAALTSLRNYLTEKPNAPDKAQVQAQIANLESKPGTVNIESTPAGAVIWVDGENTGYLTPNEISVRSGNHVVRLTAPSYQNVEQSINVGIGTHQRLSLSLNADAPVAVADATDAQPAPVQEDEGPKRHRHAGPAVWSTLAVAGATAVIGTGLGVAALKTKSDYDDNPTQAKIDKGEKLALFADVSFGIAIVAGVTSFVLYMTSGKNETPPAEATASWKLSPEISPNKVGMSGSMRF